MIVPSDTPLQSGREPKVTTEALSTTYYRDNFLCLLASVTSRYDAVLTQEERTFVSSFQACSLGAQCLYVRLVSRKGPLFRSDKLQYPEIQALPEALTELAQAGLVNIDPSVPLRDTLDRMTVPELQSRLGGVKGLRKSELVERLCTIYEPEGGDGTSWRHLLELPFQLVRPAHDVALARLRLMFFGNLHQELSEFVLADLGVFQYESYGLDGTAAAFTARGQVDALFQAIQWRLAVYQALDGNDVEAIAGLATEIGQSDFLPAARTLSKGLNQLGRYYERQGEFSNALSLYRQSDVAPARERIARILYAQKDWGQAFSQCESIMAEPWNEQEALAATRIRDRCLRQLGRLQAGSNRPQALSNRPRTTKSGSSYPVDTLIIDSSRHQEKSVELQALAHLLQESGGEGYYVENWLMNALFGLLFWDVIFAPVTDAFYHPFQRGPVDLYRPEFRRKRQGLFEARMAKLIDVQWCRTQVQQTWLAKFGILNPFVAWTTEDEPRLMRTLEQIPPIHLQQIFSRMLLDLRNHCSGFPDLIRLLPAGSYELIEVKGPGDRVQDHQARWLDYFAQEGIAARVVHVVYATAYTDASAHTGSTTL